jgi:hypothetical protein
MALIVARGTGKHLGSSEGDFPGAEVDVEGVSTQEVQPQDAVG